MLTIREPAETNREQAEVPLLMIATAVFGASGQPWMWRQVVGIEGFRKELVCWERHNADIQPAQGVREHVLAGKVAPYHNDGRWLYRCRAIREGSFYAAIGDERKRLGELLRSRAPDVLLCNFGDIAMRLAPSARATRVPLVAYFHGDFSFILNRWYRWSLYRSHRDFAAIVVVTEAERKWLVAHGVPSEKIHYIPCGAPTHIFRPSAGHSSDLVRFIMVSRLSAEKGCDISIKAFAQVAAVNPAARLDIFGDGPERQALERLAGELGIADKVVFHGYIGEADLVRELPDYDIFIQHSRGREGSPVSIVEAMACGLPVVATPVGGIPDQVVSGVTGLLVAEGRLDAMAEAMTRLAADQALRKRYGAAARQRAVEHHDSTRQTQRLGELLASVAGRSRSAFHKSV